MCTHVTPKVESLQLWLTTIITCLFFITISIEKIISFCLHPCKLCRSLYRDAPFAIEHFREILSSWSSLNVISNYLNTESRVQAANMRLYSFERLQYTSVDILFKFGCLKQIKMIITPQGLQMFWSTGLANPRYPSFLAVGIKCKSNKMYNLKGKRVKWHCTTITARMCW